MSTRTHIVSFASLDPIRNAVASNDAELVEALMRHYVDEIRARYRDDELDDVDLEEETSEFREFVESMVMCPKPPNAEPGAWNYVVRRLAAHFGLGLEDGYSFNEGWKHYHVWEPYRGMLAGRIPPAAGELLAHLEHGRPLRGAKIDHDGCVFAWLDPAEVAELHAALAGVDASAITDEDLVEFHETLVESLGRIRDRGAVLFLAAQ